MKVDCSRVTHPFATAFSMYCYTEKTVRLACLNHAASVHSEPGSNSPKRVMNLVIHELLLTLGICLSANAPFLNFDWGSQSIAQSKFQRASRLGKENQQRIFEERRQHFFRTFFRIFGAAFKRTLHPFVDSLTVLRRADQQKGRGTCKALSAVQAFSNKFRSNYATSVRWATWIATNSR